MQKYFTYIFLALLFIALGLSAAATTRMQSRFQAIEQQLEQQDMMIEVMIDRLEYLTNN